MSGEFQYCLNLLALEAIEHLNNLVHGKAVFQVFKNRGYRNASAAKNPSTTELSWNALHRTAL